MTEISFQVKDPLSMFSGDMLTVNVNLSGLPVRINTLMWSCGLAFVVWSHNNVQAIVVRSGLMEVENECLPFGLQFIGRPFRWERKCKRVSGR